MCESMPPSFDRLLAHAKTHDGRIVIAYGKDDDRGWMIAYEYGDIVGNLQDELEPKTTYGLGEDLDSALGDVMDLADLQ